MCPNRKCLGVSSEKILFFMTVALCNLHEIHCKSL